MDWQQLVIAPRQVRVVLLFAYAGYLLVASVMDPATSGVTLEPVGPFGLVGFDKWLHVLSYGTLAFFGVYATLARSRRALVGVFAAAVAYGVAIELVQAFLPARSFSVLDVAANAVGAGLVVGGVATFLWLRGRSETRSLSLVEK